MVVGLQRLVSSYVVDEMVFIFLLGVSLLIRTRSCSRIGIMVKKSKIGYIWAKGDTGQERKVLCLFIVSYMG